VFRDDPRMLRADMSQNGRSGGVRASIFGCVVALLCLACPSPIRAADGNGWAVSTVHALPWPGSTGLQTDLTLDADDRPHMAFVAMPEAGNGVIHLYAARWDGSAWKVDLVDVLGRGFWYVASTPSMRVDSQGREHIVYFRQRTELRYAHQGPGGWEIEPVPGGTGRYSSFALDDQERPHVAFCAGGSVVYGIRSDGAWSLRTTPAPCTMDGDFGGEMSLAVDSSGLPHIASVHGAVRYAHFDGSRWLVESVASHPSDPDAIWVAAGPKLGLDAEGRPHIAFGPLSYLRPDGSLYFPGPSYAVRNSGGWSVETTVEGSGNDSIALAFDPDGAPHLVAWAQDSRGSAPGFHHLVKEAGAWRAERIFEGGWSGFIYSGIAIDAEGGVHVGTGDAGLYSAVYAYHAGPGCRCSVSVDDATVAEGDTGMASVTFTATLSAASAKVVQVSYTTAAGTATADSDYVGTTGTLVYEPWETTRTVNVPVVGDADAESNEGFAVTLSDPVNVTIGRGTGFGTILDDDRVGAVPRAQAAWHEWFAVDVLETPFVGDFDGDGRADIITFTRQNRNAVGDVYVALSEGTRFGPNRKWHDWFAITTDETVIIGDYNGDGKDDIATWLGRTTRQVYVALSTGSGMAKETVWLDRIGSDSSDVLASGDYDRDGKSDLICFSRTEGKVYVARAAYSSFYLPGVAHGFFAVSTYERPRVGDVNGDRMTDILTFATDSPTAFGDVYAAFSNGDRFTDVDGSPDSSTKWHDWFAIRPEEEVRIGDLDGDGRDDLFTFLPPHWGQCYTVRSLGNSMGPNVLWPSIVTPGAKDKPFVGDVNGDGKADVIVFAQGEGKVYVSLAP
jgi:hypothetical protein